MRTFRINPADVRPNPQPADQTPNEDALEAIARLLVEQAEETIGASNDPPQDNQN